jgi:hypothetical protein
MAIDAADSLIKHNEPRSRRDLCLIVGGHLMKRCAYYFAVLLLLVATAACAAHKADTTDNHQYVYKYDTETHRGEVEQSKDSKTGERVNYMLGGKDLEDCIKIKGWHACQ